MSEAKRATVAAAFGTFLEYYDFSVYGYCAARMSKEFFPSDNPTVSLLSTLAVFGLAFIIRPLGGLGGLLLHHFLHGILDCLFRRNRRLGLLDGPQNLQIVFVRLYPVPIVEIRVAVHEAAVDFKLNALGCGIVL